MSQSALNQSTKAIQAKADTKIEKEFALYELQHALLDGVFEPIRKTKNSHLQAREIVGYSDYVDKKGERHKDALRLKLLVPYHLTPQAETILLALIKLAGTNGLRDGLEIEPPQPTLPMLFATAEGEAKDKTTAITAISQYKLLQEAGMSNGKRDYELLNQYLEYMSAMTVTFKNSVSGWSGSDHFMSYRAHEDGRLIIKLNWRLAGAIFGDYLYAEIDLKERRALEKDASKTLHRWLSAKLWKGKSEYLKYNTLIKHIWTQEATPNTQRWRLYTLKHEILPEIAKLEAWTIEMSKEGARITHLKN